MISPQHTVFSRLSSYLLVATGTCVILAAAKKPPYPLPHGDPSNERYLDDYYGYCSEACQFQFQHHLSPDQQRIYEHCWARINDLEEQIEDGNEILVAEEDAEDLPENILDAVKGNKIEEIVNWLDYNPNKLRRVNFITNNGTCDLF